tara:strand:+ start:268 stop:531 length:264 start_codon:yes stop_codon:yes gene_type:complete
MNKSKKVVVLGGGSFGTVLANLAASNGYQVAEGIRTLDVIKNESSELDIKMPLVESLYNIIYEGGQPHALISDLVKNPHEVDVEFKY